MTKTAQQILKKLYCIISLQTDKFEKGKMKLTKKGCKPRLIDKIIKGNFEVKPKFMCMICGLYDAVIRRPDGIYVLPITALKP